MQDGCIPVDLLYEKLAEGSRFQGHPRLCFKVTCKRNMNSPGIDTQSLESLVVVV